LELDIVSYLPVREERTQTGFLNDVVGLI